MARVPRLLATLATIATTVWAAPAWCDAPAAGEASPPPVQASDDSARLACFTQHEEAQIARRDRRLLAARSALRLCSAAACRDAIRADCIEWMDQVDRSIPSAVVSARARGEDLTDVKVFVDGKLAADRLSGAALELDPGEHHFRVESPSWPPVERSVLMSEGVKNRPIEIELAPPAPPAATVATGPSEPPRPRLERHLHRFDYVVGGIGLGALATGAAVGSWALVQRHQLSHDCAPFCSSEEQTSLRTKLVIADVSFGVAAAALVIASVHFLRSGEPVVEPPPRFSLLLGAGEGGARLGLAGVF